MTPITQVPDDAHCRGCGYPLRGLPGDICPECGRGFDRSDPRTFDHSARVSNRRRWANRAVVWVLFALPILVVCPQGLRRGSITFKCQTCGTMIESRRWEMIPPPWIPVRYPGRARSTTVSAPASTVVPCVSHQFSVSTAFESPMCKATSSRPYQPQLPTINGRLTTPDNAESVLADLMHPSNTGVGP